MRVCLIVVLFVLSEYCIAQQLSTANFEGRAIIIAPMSVDKYEDMDFGELIVRGNSGGNVVLTPTGDVSTSGGVLPHNIETNAKAAIINVRGENNFSYVLTLPSYAVLSDVLGNTMLISSFTSVPANYGTLTSGYQLISIGATLNINAGQHPGEYRTRDNSGFLVTVNYY